MDEYKKNFTDEYGDQSSTKYFEDYGVLFSAPTMLNIIKALLLVSFISVFIANVRDIHFDLMSQHNDVRSYIYFQKNFQLFLWGFCQCLLCIAFSLLYHFVNIKRFYFILIILILCSMFMILIPSIHVHLNILIGFANSLFYFYFLLTYLYFSETTLTKVRNATTSFILIVSSIAFLIQLFVVRALIQSYLYSTIIANCILLIGFGFFEYFLNKEETRNSGLHEIEVELLRNKNRSR